MKACYLCNLDLFKTDFEISGLTSEANCKFTTFLRAANPLILWAPPEIFIVAGRTRSDLAISPAHSGVTTSKPKTSRKVTNLFANLTRSWCITCGYFHISNYLASQWRNRLIPKFKVSSEMTGHT